MYSGVSRMAPLVEIASATEADLPRLAYIQCAAMHDELIHQFIFTDRDDVLAEKLSLDQLRGWAKNPNSQTFKATAQDSSEIVAYANIRFEDCTEEKNDGVKNDGVKTVPSEGSTQRSVPSKQPPPAGFPLGMNADFARLFFGEMKAIHSRHMGGKKHFRQSFLSAIVQ